MSSQKGTHGKDHSTNQRLTFLAEASKILASSLDYHTTLASLAQLAVPSIADWCGVDVVEADGHQRRLAVAHVDPAKVRLAEDLQRRYPNDSGQPSSVETVIATGQPFLLEEILPEMLTAAAQDAEHLELLQAIGFSSVMIIPLNARGRTLGAITLVAAESGHLFGSDDLTLAEDLANRAALAIDNALLYREAQRVAAIFAVAPDPILILGHDGRILDLNPAVESVLGWARGELTGQPVTVILAPDERAQTLQRLEQVWRGEALLPREAQLITRSGEVRYVLSSDALLRDERNQPTGVVALYRDVTLKTQAQARLQNSLAQMELITRIGERILAARTRQELFDSVAAGLVGHDGYDAVAFFAVNQRADQLELQTYLGMGSDRAPRSFSIPLGEGISGWVVAHGLPQIVADTDLDSRTIRIHPHWRYRSEVDVPVVVQDRVVAVISAMHEQVGVFGLEHCRALEAIAHRVAIGLERVALHEELQTKNDEMEAFLYAASHDLRSPLVNVLGFSQELQTAVGDLRYLADGLNLSQQQRAQLEDLWAQDIQPALRFIHASVKKMEMLVDGLLQLSRIGRQALVYEPLDLTVLVQDVLDSMRAEVDAAGATITVGALPPVEADWSRLSQVFSNLIGNAIKYADPDRACRIEITGESGEGCSRYCVVDNGIGIAAQHVEAIFKPFHRLNLHDGKGGHGLGLSIVDRIVRRHGGHMRVESTPGQGSRFWIELPSQQQI